MPRFPSAGTKVNTKIAVKNGPFFRLPQNQAANGKRVLASKRMVHLKAEVQGPLAAAKLEENRTIGAAVRACPLREHLRNRKHGTNHARFRCRADGVWALPP